MSGSGSTIPTSTSRATITAASGAKPRSPADRSSRCPRAAVGWGITDVHEEHREHEIAVELAGRATASRPPGRVPRCSSSSGRPDTRALLDSSCCVRGQSNCVDASFFAAVSSGSSSRFDGSASSASSAAPPWRTRPSASPRERLRAAPSRQRTRSRSKIGSSELTRSEHGSSLWLVGVLRLRTFRPRPGRAAYRSVRACRRDSGCSGSAGSTSSGVSGPRS